MNLNLSRLESTSDMAALPSRTLGDSSSSWRKSCNGDNQITNPGLPAGSTPFGACTTQKELGDLIK